MSSAINRVLKHNLKAALRRNQFEEAALLLERLQREDPLSGETRGLELELLIESGRLNEAIPLAEQLEHLFPSSSRIQFLCGKLHYRRKGYAAAVDFFRESYRLFPHWQSRYWLGKTLTQTGELDEAQSLLEAVAPGRPFVENDLAWLFERKKDWERALALYEKALQRAPDSPFLEQRIAKIKGMMLQPEELIEELETLMELGEPIPESLFGPYIEQLFKTGRGAQAREEIRERAGALLPGPKVDLAWKCFHAQAFDLAFELFCQVFEREMNKPTFLNCIQASARKCRRLEELAALYETHAPRQKNLFGRLKKLKKEL